MTKSDRDEPEDRAMGHGGVAAVDRALAILGAFDDHTPALSLAELSRRTGFYKSTILRLAKSLEASGLLVRSVDGNFRLGSEILRLGSLYQTSQVPRAVTLPIMRELSNSVGESVALYVPEGNNHRICLYRVNALRPVNYVIQPGDRAELPLGSSGQMIAAFLGWQGGEFGRLRQAMITFSSGQRNPELASVSVPVFSEGEHLAGVLTIGGPTGRVNEAFASDVSATLFDAAIMISTELGGRTDHLQAAKARATGQSS